MLRGLEVIIYCEMMFFREIKGVLSNKVLLLSQCKETNHKCVLDHPIF